MQMIPVTNSISIYKGELTKAELAIQSNKILAIFPKFPKSMLESLKEAFADNDFNDERMIASVKNVRDTYEGWDKLPNIANFIQFDKEIKFHTYNDMLNLTTEMSPKLREQWLGDHIYTKVNGELRYISKTDHNKFKHLFGEQHEL